MEKAQDEDSASKQGFAQRHRGPLIVALSLVLQVPLAVFLGHYYDDRVFMATGYLVSNGLNPYQPHLFTGVFDNPQLLGVIPSIGYPPPWPLLLGAIYKVSYNILPNIFVYNFAIKIPIIISNIALAYLVRNLILKFGGDKKRAQYAWLFVLFSPFVLLTTAAWGDFDTIVALTCVASLYLASKGRTIESALILAVGVALKPIAIPLIGLPLFFSGSKKRSLQYLLSFSGTFLVCYFGAFLALGWPLPWGPGEWNTQFVALGGMTPFNLVEVLHFSATLPSSYEFVGFLWLPALLAGYYAIHVNRPTSADALFQKAVAVTLIFFLTRVWLSEPNINLLLPLMLLAASSGKLSFRSFHFAWILPFIFLFLNYAFPQLFFLVYPSTISSLANLDQQIGGIRLLARFLVTVPWQVLGWAVVVKSLRGSKSSSNNESVDLPTNALISNT